MWVACCHFQKLFCFTDANAPFLSLSCAIIWRSMGKVAWSSLWPYLLNPLWPCLTWWKICLEWPSSKQHGLWWCLHMVNAHTEGGSAVTRSHSMMSWSLWLLLGFLFASTLPSCSLVLYYTYPGAPLHLPWCSCLCALLLQPARYWTLLCVSFQNPVTVWEHKPNRNGKNITCCKPLEKGLLNFPARWIWNIIFAVNSNNLKLDNKRS